MPQFFIQTRNSAFYARDGGAEYTHAEAALALGVQGALSIAADEIGRGERTAAVEVSVEQEDGTRLFSSVVAVSVSPLLARETDGSLDDIGHD